MTTENGQTQSRDTVAGLIEEIKLLVDMVIEHSAPWLEGIIAAGHGTGHAGTGPAAAEPKPSAGSGCGWCPLCAIVAVVRGERPEFSARVLEHAAQLVALLRAVLADRWYPEGGVHMPGFRPDPPPRFPVAESERTAPWREPSPVERTMPLPKTGAASPRVQRVEVRKVGAGDVARARE